MIPYQTGCCKECKCCRYIEIEAPLQDMIWNKWLDKPLSEEETTQVFAIDDAILAHEFLCLMDAQIVDSIPPIVSKPQFEFTGFEQSQREFLRLFRLLTAGEKE